MIQGLSQLSKITQAVHNDMPARFNSSLPITIEVLKKRPFGRYSLKLGNKHMDTKSHKELDEGALYWGDFGENKDGIITISNLIKKPTFFQFEPLFLNIEIDEFLSQFNDLDYKISTYKNWLIGNMSKESISKEEFMLFSSMLLALKQRIFHLPLQINSRGMLLQFDFAQDGIRFYAAYENLGPVGGFIDESNHLQISVCYSKSAHFFTQQLSDKELDFALRLDESPKPLYENDALVLDLKG